MTQFCYVTYVEKGFPKTDYKCALCNSREEVDQFILENDDIDVVEVVESSEDLSIKVRGAIIKLLHGTEIDVSEKKLLNELALGGMFIGKRN